MRLQNIVVMVSVVFLLNGCSTGQMMKNSYQGTQYLQTGNYSQGEVIFRKTVARNPGDPLANYYLGRFLLAQKETQEALPYLQKAVLLEPENTDYLFWQGVALGALGKQKQERKSYRQVLRIDERHLQALTYYGHNQLKEREYEAALATYQEVLQIFPDSPSALYNRALIAKILNRTPEEKAGWLAYLAKYPSGDLAIQAINHLNLLGEFTYQNHYLGARTIPLKKIWFEPFSANLYPSSKRSLDVVGATAVNIGRAKLQVIVFQENNMELAKDRAISIKEYLSATFPDLTPEKIGVSWFKQPEAMELQGKKLQNPGSVRFFLTDLEIPILSSKKKKRITFTPLRTPQEKKYKKMLRFALFPV